MRVIEKRYYIEVVYNGFDDSFEEELRKLLKQYPDSSCFGFMNGKRDLSWSFGTVRAQKKAAKALKNIKKYRLSFKLRTALCLLNHAANSKKKGSNIEVYDKSDDGFLGFVRRRMYLNSKCDRYIMFNGKKI